jgi:hypothetical protein
VALDALDRLKMTLRFPRPWSAEDSKAKNLGKIFEGAYYSIGRPK